MSAPITPNCLQYKHSDFGSFTTDSPHVELLARESHERIHEIDSVLYQVLVLTPAPPQTPSLLGAMPVVALSFNQLSQSTQRSTGSITVADRPDMLRAFARLMRHSQKLNAYPALKTVFWVAIAKTLVDPCAINLHRQLFALPAFPRFAIHCDYDYQRYGAWSTVNQALCDAIYDEIFTTATAAESGPAIAIALSFTASSPQPVLTLSQLALIETLLDRIATTTTTTSSSVFQLTALDLSNNMLDVPQLEIVARMVAKCTSGRYTTLEQLTLNGVRPPYGTADTPRAFLDITSAAFHTGVTMPKFWTVTPPPLLPSPRSRHPSPLRTIALSKNELTLSSFFPSHFSAMRYGCPLDQDLTEYAIGGGSPRDEDNGLTIDAWRWLAFGLFYPRPARFASQSKLRTLGKLTISPLMIRTIVRTLRNPVAQLVDNDLEGNDTSMADALLVCTVAKGAAIRVFVSGVGYEDVENRRRPVDPSRYETLVETSELEALCERADGSVCVVVPGAGLGWVEKQDVVRLDREPLYSGVRAAHAGRYHVAMGMGDTTSMRVGELRALFQCIGRQFRSLTFEYFHSSGGGFGGGGFELQPNADGTPETVMQFISDYCPHLQHLNVIGASPEEVSDLLRALEGPLGSRLVTLNLNDPAKALSDAEITRLAAILSDTTKPQALRELRLVRSWFQPAEGLAKLHDALRVNQTLTVLELLRRRETSDVAHLREQARLDESFQGQVLKYRTPMATKVAFLSAVCSRNTPHEYEWNESVLAMVFAFAAIPETRRLVAWKENFEFLGHMTR